MVKAGKKQGTRASDLLGLDEFSECWDLIRKSVPHWPPKLERNTDPPRRHCEVSNDLP